MRRLIVVPMIAVSVVSAIVLATKPDPHPVDKQYGGGIFAATPAFYDDFNADWEKSQTDWRVATWKQNKTEMSPERCKTDRKGHLIQTILPGDPAKGGSMQTAKEYPHGRWIARVKPSSTPGVLNSIFTKDWDDLKTEKPENDGNGFEVDIEFLTYTFAKDKGQVHIAVHAAGKPNIVKQDIDLDFNPSDDFHIWGFDILPDKIVWHVDGKVLHTWQSPDPISANYEFFFNSWHQKKWVKGPPEKQADYTIDWVRFYPVDETKK